MERLHGHNWRTIWPILFKMCTLTKHHPGPSAALILQSSLLTPQEGSIWNPVQCSRLQTWQKSVCQLVNGVNFAAFIGHWKLKRLSALGGFAPWPPDQGLCPWAPLGLRSQTPVIVSRSPCADPLAMVSVLGSLNIKLGPGTHPIK